MSQPLVCYQRYIPLMFLVSQSLNLSHLNQTHLGTLRVAQWIGGTPETEALTLRTKPTICGTEGFLEPDLGAWYHLVPDQVEL